MPLYGLQLCMPRPIPPADPSLTFGMSAYDQFVDKMDANQVAIVEAFMEQVDLMNDDQNAQPDVARTARLEAAPRRTPTANKYWKGAQWLSSLIHGKPA